jgi:hypothetical protein
VFSNKYMSDTVLKQIGKCLVVNWNISKLIIARACQTGWAALASVWPVPCRKSVVWVPPVRAVAHWNGPSVRIETTTQD